MNCPIPKNEMSVYDQIVWSERKAELDYQQKFFALIIAGCADYIREKKLSIDLSTVTADEIITLCRK